MHIERKEMLPKLSYTETVYCYTDGHLGARLTDRVGWVRFTRSRRIGASVVLGVGLEVGLSWVCRRKGSRMRVELMLSQRLGDRRRCAIDFELG